jgi:hypothetical protein
MTALSRIQQNCLGIVILVIVNFFLWPIRAAVNVRVPLVIGVAVLMMEIALRLQSHVATRDCVLQLKTAMWDILEECFVMLDPSKVKEMAEDPAKQREWIQPEANLLTALAAVEEKCGALKVGFCCRVLSSAWS